MNGYADGDTCGRNGCNGAIEIHPPENCSCHINPPCSSCTDPRNFCPVCGWEEKYDNLEEEEKQKNENVKRIGYWRKTESSTEDLPWPVETGRLPQLTKQRIAEYLMKGKEHSAWKGWSSCRICGKRNGTTCMTDGEFVYPEGYAHYIFDHNVMPDSDLMAKILTLK